MAMLTRTEYRELSIANGNLSVAELEGALNDLPIRGTPAVSPLQPVYCVGLTTCDSAHAVGAWLDGDTLYLDPVYLTDNAPDAYYLAAEHGQVAIFKMTGIWETADIKIEGDYDPLYRKLAEYSAKYGGATAVRVGLKIYRVIAGDGEVVYL